MSDLNEVVLKAKILGYKKGFSDGYEKAKKEMNKCGVVKPLFE